MALIQCPDCGVDVSDRAAACPKCACPIAEIVKEQGTPMRPRSSSSAPDATEGPGQERTVWEGRPSQVINLGAYLLWGLVVLVSAALGFWYQDFGYAWLAVIPILVGLFMMLWKYLDVRVRRIELTTERVRTHRGILSKQIDELEIYRIKDSRVRQPLFLRIFGLGTVELETSDRTNPEVKLHAIRDPRGLREELRKYVEIQRDRKRVREVDFE
jgi:membrane protein YdbS with pleckstrin-like domain